MGKYRELVTKAVDKGSQGREVFSWLVATKEAWATTQAFFFIRIFLNHYVQNTLDAGTHL